MFLFIIRFGGQALQAIFQLGFIPQEKDFLELTDEQYRLFRLKEGECDEKSL